jgi:hypothetical protein
LAANLFWNNWPSLTGMFIRINNFLASIHSENRDPAILTHWAGVRFLLDSQRAKLHERRNSRCFKRVEWNDMRLVEREGWHVLEWAEGKGGGKEQLETIQAAMLEMVMPVLPHRLNEDWRRVIESIDILDIPGMRAGRQGAEQGKRQSADAIEEQMEIIKRGKVAYLFERYTDEMLIQTLLLLARGGNLEVTAQMKYHIDKWGRARYGEDAWPSKVKDKLPALFLGITGIDEEFRNRDEYANHMLYETRLTQVADALGEVMSDFGGVGQAFTNVYPLRYPGTWDADQEQREKAGVEKWVRAEEAFMKSKMVAKHCANPAEKWKAAMTDNDGGLSLISRGWREVTTAHKKQEQLENGIKEVRTRLHQLSQGWVVNADSNIDREQRKQCADRVLDWLASNPQAIYDRVRVMEKTLGFEDGEQYALSDFADIPVRAGVGRPESLERRFAKKLQEYLHEWATVSTVEKWDKNTRAHPQGGPWLGSEDFGQFTRYLRDALCAGGNFEQVSQQLLKVVNLKLRDDSAKRRARRKYVSIMMNDYVMNPGPTDERIQSVEEANPEDFGLMSSFVTRWQSRLPEFLASGAGAEVRVPPGNTELAQIIERYSSITY